MTLLHSVLFGVIEGLTEFIPISSTGHMLVTQRLLGLPSTDAMFAYIVLIQLGAIAALVAFFWRDFWLLLRTFFAVPFSTPRNRMAWLILIATMPALLVGALLRDVVQVLFEQPLLEAAIRFLTAAGILAFAEWFGHRSRGIASMSWVDALVIGLFQVLAVFPGASRSGAAIGGGMMRNLDRASATRFAFFLSGPIMLVAGICETAGVIRLGGADLQLPVLLVGVLVAALVGWLSIRWLIQYVARHPLYSFAVYCSLLGVVCLAVYWA